MARIVCTKSFHSDLRSLQQQGQKRIVQAVRAAMTEAGVEGEIRALPRTRHGETRLANVEKYDLPDAYRLVVQLVDGHERTRAFLFVGCHADADRWLDAHRNYRWVKSRTDGTLEFLQVTERTEERYVPADRVDLDSPEEILEEPLLRFLSDEEWALLGLGGNARSFAQSVTGSDYERDADGIQARLEQLCGAVAANTVWDLCYHAHAREWSEFQQRLNVARGQAAVAPPDEVAPAMVAAANSEAFITLDDADALNGYVNARSMADWMLFLHPEQRKVAERDFRGAARLRGVSGSGKTSVLVHRARYVAKKYRQDVLLVTLAESMRKLLEQLVDDLCGVERDLITAMTMSATARQVVQDLHPSRANWYSVIAQSLQDDLFFGAAERVRGHPDISRTSFHGTTVDQTAAFLRDEIPYVRSRLRSSEIEQYVDPSAFRRYGRGVALNEASRRVVLDAIRFYERELESRHLLDHESIVDVALGLVDGKRARFDRYRCVLCDEVQDLSQLEVALLGRLSTPSGEPMATAENGLFLAGDGAQTIYKRGFALRSVGVDVTSRSFNLKKNYRNTYEILKAAFGLVSQYEFADTDEEQVSRPSEPEFAKRHGSRPLIVRCDSPNDEASAVAASVRSLLAMGHTAGQICIVGPSTWLRTAVQTALAMLGIDYTDLKQDVDFESDRVKVSTIESAKGHEFGAVFIMGLVEGVLPNEDSEQEISREAARLYVAMTRARDSLTITYSPTGGYRTSRFLLAIQSDCTEARFQDGQIVKLS